MEEPQTWRELLGQVISDTQERQRIADALGVNPLTLQRWVSNKSRPRLDNLRPLLNMLPSHHQQLRALIAREYPEVAVEGPEDEALDIPSAFYAQVLNAHTTSPPILRASAITTVIFQQILSQVDPHQLGMAVLMVQCVPPAPGAKVQSLRKTHGRSIALWGSLFDYGTAFFGIESQAGQSVMTGHPIVVRSKDEQIRLFPYHQIAPIESVLAIPVLLADRVAGCLCLISTQRNHFTVARMRLAQSYANLLTLAFEPDEFHSLDSIELSVMPAYTEQQAALATFQERVKRRLLEATQQQRILLRPQAEQLVWKEIEQELLRSALQPDESPSTDEGT